MSEPVERQLTTFTWIPLAVVVFLVIVVFGLGAVVLNQARDGARLNNCTCHGKQLTLGTHGFHDVHDFIPPARLSRRNHAKYGEPAPTKVSRDELGPNWLILMSPFVEHQSHYEAFDFEVQYYLSNDEGKAPQQQNEVPFWNIDGTLPDGRLARGAFDVGKSDSRGPLLRCPAETAPDIPYAGFGGGWGRGSYAINAGPCELMVGSGPAPCRLSNGAAPWGLNASGVAGVNWGVSLSVLTQQDGTANTILLSEVRFGVSPDDLRGTWALGLPGASILANAAMPFAETPNSMHPQSDRIPDCDKVQQAAGGSAALARLGMGCDPQATAAEQTAARSLHVGGVNTGFCDGNVRFISNKISPRIWFLMLSRNDGEAVKFEEE